MKEILKFGTPDRECPHCVGPQAFKQGKFSRKDIEDVYAISAEIHLHRENAHRNMREFAKKGLKGKKHVDQIKEALSHQARIEQLAHGGWDIEIQAWVNICPDCDRVTEYRAMPSHFYRFGVHGPVQESNSCTDCIDAKAQAAIEAEKLRLSKMTTEEIEAERAAIAIAETTVTQQLVDEFIAKSTGTVEEQRFILKLMNHIGDKLGNIK